MLEALQINFDEPQGRRPLYDYPNLEISRTRNLIKLHDCIAWMGVCGAIDYRQDAIPFVEDAFTAAKLSTDAMEQYTPMVKVWTPECALTEMRYLAESRFLVLPVLDTSEGQASTAEIPFGVIGSLLRGQRLFTMVEAGLPFNDKSLSVGRYITNTYMGIFADLLEPIGIQRFRSMPRLHQAVADAAIKHLTSGEKPKSQVATLRQPMLTTSVVISGSGDEKLMRAVSQHQSPELRDQFIVSDTYMPTFYNNPELNFAKETTKKTRSAVNLVTISNEHLSYGAVNEIGWLALGTVLKDQVLGIYMEPHDSPNNSSANRQRQLVMSHLGRLLQDFPWLSARIKAVASPKELADWGNYKMDEYQDWRNAMRI